MARPRPRPSQRSKSQWRNVPRPTEWVDFLETARPHLDRQSLGPILTLDPGETTGWSTWDKGDLTDSGQWDTYAPHIIADLVTQVSEDFDDQRRQLSLIVFEEYRVRGNKFKEHVGSEVITIQHIGAIKVAAAQLGVETWKQTAGQVKAFATDTKLRRWGLYQTGLRHSNDAIRHGVYYILFAAGRSK